MTDEFPNWNRRVEERQAASRTLSERVREIALGGIAVVWAFLVGEGAAADAGFRKRALVSLVLFVLVFVAEFVQYLCRWIYMSTQSKRIWRDAGKSYATADRMVQEKGYAHTVAWRISWVAFVAKQVLLLGAMAALGVALVTLWPSS
ncbi:MAG: hypothetical protein QME96_18655 [Myxococcota bacterium]|nr:hypothetical protein [Myxococcota bacterium]